MHHQNLSKLLSRITDKIKHASILFTQLRMISPKIMVTSIGCCKMDLNTKLNSLHITMFGSNDFMMIQQ